ncbi:MAG: hypothetical protein BWY21_00319 [Parcubacteria group bacterium ADurb.Bin216]|nr:MAG: hypothetical protein BWY21_00319 [Parcubacteria group bacterium ADurb.Bin216]
MTTKPTKVMATVGTNCTFKHSVGKSPVAFFHLESKGDIYNCVCFGDIALKAQKEITFGKRGNFELRKNDDGKYVCQFFLLEDSARIKEEQAKRFLTKEDKQNLKEYNTKMLLDGFVKANIKINGKIEKVWKKTEDCIELSNGDYTPKIEFVMDVLTPEYVTSELRREIGANIGQILKRKDLKQRYRVVLDRLITEAFEVDIRNQF